MTLASDKNSFGAIHNHYTDVCLYAHTHEIALALFRSFLHGNLNWFTPGLYKSYPIALDHLGYLLYCWLPMQSTIVQSSTILQFFSGKLTSYHSIARELPHSFVLWMCTFYALHCTTSLISFKRHYRFRYRLKVEEVKISNSSKLKCT